MFDAYTSLYIKIDDILRQKVEISTYDITPETDTPYPFAILEPFDNSIGLVTKEGIHSENFKVYISIYDYKRNFGDVTRTLTNIINQLASIHEIDGHRVVPIKQSINKRIMVDTTTKDVLLHGSMSMEFNVFY